MFNARIIRNLHVHCENKTETLQLKHALHCNTKALERKQKNAVFNFEDKRAK